jgi:hypothetical protein
MDHNLQVSGWKTYPDLIKFHSIEWYFSKDSDKITRTYFGLFEFIAQVGGLYTALTFLVFLLPLYGELKILAIITKRAYFDPTRKAVNLL